MENAQYFALGVLTVLGLASLITIVVGMFKVIRTEKKLRDLESCLSTEVNSLSDSIYDLQESMKSLIDSVEKTLSDRIDKLHTTNQEDFDLFEKQLKEVTFKMSEETGNRIASDKWNLSQLDRVENKFFDKISVLDKIAKESPNYKEYSMDSLEKNIENLTKK